MAVPAFRPENVRPQTESDSAIACLMLALMPCRSDIAFGDWHAVKQQIDKAKKLCDEGGDWERKNRLKVYEALFLMVTRDFKKAGELFLDSTATFGA